MAKCCTKGKDILPGRVGFCTKGEGETVNAQEASFDDSLSTSTTRGRVSLLLAVVESEVPEKL